MQYYYSDLEQEQSQEILAAKQYFKWAYENKIYSHKTFNELNGKNRKIYDPPESDPAYGYAFLYLCSQSGRGGNILYYMTTKDAQTLCADDRTCGQMYGGQWMLVYISVSNFRDNIDNVIDFKKLKSAKSDKGSQDEIIEELMLTKYKITKKDMQKFGFILRNAKSN